MLVMKILRLLFILALWAVGAAAVQTADNLTRRELTVDGVVPQGLVYVPAQARTNATPVVFAFHGHGGSMRNAARSFGYHALWPEAIVVYLQGLNTPGRLTDPDGKNPGCLRGSNPSRCCMWPVRTIRWSNSPGRSKRWMRSEN